MVYFQMSLFSWLVLTSIMSAICTSLSSSVQPQSTSGLRYSCARIRCGVILGLREGARVGICNEGRVWRGCLPSAVGMDRFAHDRGEARQKRDMLVQHVAVVAGRARLRHLCIVYARKVMRVCESSLYSAPRSEHTSHTHLRQLNVGQRAVQHSQQCGAVEAHLPSISYTAERVSSAGACTHVKTYVYI